MRIGFFDSGIGGVSVLAEALEYYPDQEYLYDADVDHVPYGEKTAEEIAHYARENARFLLSSGAQALVVACNTATAVAIGAIREMTDIPVIGMEPAVKPAVEGLPGDCGSRTRVLVAATPVTLREAKLKDLIRRVDPEHIVDLLALPELVQLAEKCMFDSAEARAYLQDRFSGIDPAAYSAFVIGCTHFQYFKPLFRDLLGPDIRRVDGNSGTVRRLGSVLGLEKGDAENAGKNPRISWFRSGRAVEDAEGIRYFSVFLDRAGSVKSF